MFASSSRIEQNAFCCTQKTATSVNTLLDLQKQSEPLKMASALPAVILCKIVDKLSLKDKFKTLSISTKWNNASSTLLELQTGLGFTNEIDGDVLKICDEETHRIDSKAWLPVSLLTNERALDTVLKKLPKLKAVAGRYVDCEMLYKFIQLVMKNGIEIECLAGFSDIIHLSSLKHFYGKVDNDSLSHLIKLNKDLEVLIISDAGRYLGDNFIGNMIHLKRLHKLHMTFHMDSNVSEEDFLEFITKWKQLNLGHLNILLTQHVNIETDTVHAKLATTSNVTFRFIRSSEIVRTYSKELPPPLRKVTRDPLGLTLETHIYPEMEESIDNILNSLLLLETLGIK